MTPFGCAGELQKLNGYFGIPITHKALACVLPLAGSFNLRMGYNPLEHQIAIHMRHRLAFAILILNLQNPVSVIQ